MKIRRVGAEVFHADRQTDRRDESFRNFVNEHKNCLITTIGVTFLFILFNGYFIVNGVSDT